MLTLPIKSKWFNMIRSGEKKEEYRANTDYYKARFSGSLGRPIWMRLRNGYGADRPTIEVRVRPRLDRGARSEWGGDPEEMCWILEILKVLDVRLVRQQGEEANDV